MLTYDMADSWWKTLDAADSLADAPDNDSDAISYLCTLSGVGEWQTAENGQPEYFAPIGGGNAQDLTETGVSPIESYSPGGASIPTLVAQHFGLGEIYVCISSGHYLQGKDLIDRNVHRILDSDSSQPTIVPTTLKDIVADDADEYTGWEPLRWSHIQQVVDEDGGQTAQFALLAGILRRLAEVQMDSETFVPYGHQFADSDFVDMNL